MKNFKIRMIGVSLLCILLAGVAPQVTFGMEPPPPCEGGGDPILEGPPVSGFLAFVNSKPEEYLGMVTFLGTCNKQLVTKKFCQDYEFIAGGFEAITKDNLINLVLGDFGPPECCSFCGSEPLVITNVRKFKNTGERITAEIVLRCFTCPPPPE
jgi:hypothetical protein